MDWLRKSTGNHGISQSNSGCSSDDHCQQGHGTSFCHHSGVPLKHGTWNMEFQRWVYQCCLLLSKILFLNPFFIFTPRNTWNILGSTNFWWFHPKIFPPSWHIGVLIPSDFFWRAQPAQPPSRGGGRWHEWHGGQDSWGRMGVEKKTWVNKTSTGPKLTIWILYDNVW